jgi:hypothetical protein
VIGQSSLTVYPLSRGEILTPHLNHVVLSK